MRTAWAVGAGLVMSVAAQPAIASNLPFNNTAEAALSEDIVVPDESKMYSHGPRFLTAPGAITAVWANTGEDKVAQEELRTRKGNRVILNRTWDGKAVHLFGARNEVVAFNLVLEAGR